METKTLSANRSAEFGLEPENFRVDSTGWAEWRTPNGVMVKHDAACGITEILEGSNAGEQLFTLDAAIDETAKAGKRMPTRKEWKGILLRINPDFDETAEWYDDVSIRETLGLAMPGSREPNSGTHYYDGAYGYYWAASQIGDRSPYGHAFAVSPKQFSPLAEAFRFFGYSVRCLAN